MSTTLKVLVVDDSPTARELLIHIINASPDMHVAGEAGNGREAVQLTRDLRPDVVVMDLIMEGMNGLEATHEIMCSTPTPIVVVSASLDNNETEIAFQAMNMGALAVHRKPAGLLSPDYDEQAEDLVNKLRLMAGVRVIRHWKQDRNGYSVIPRSQPPVSARATPEIVAIVASTGGPAALSAILRDLPADFQVPIAIVQHISIDFVTSLANWMSQVTPLHVSIAQAGERLIPGHVYLAPDRVHLRVLKNRRFKLDPDAGNKRHVPSGDILLQSVAQSYGPRAIGAVLTGIGEDGAHGLWAMHEAGAFTISQDKATSVVYGMPQAAAKLGAAQSVLPLSEIAPTLVRLTQAQKASS
ncbi:MAG: chemotaxis-specific protein-glutamate methyltransferase CheB [Anaerolineae bacterium]|nr:chemotaxis-specific protein-glutamate methyltransferase CheB [Anaerolineae bacterium]